MEKKGSELAIRKLIIIILTLLVIIILLLFPSSKIRESFFNWIKNLPEYKYEHDEEIVITDGSKELFKMRGCEVPVAMVGSDPFTTKIGKDRKLYYFDYINGKIYSYLSKNYYWYGNNIENLKIYLLKKRIGIDWLASDLEVGKVEKGVIKINPELLKSPDIPNHYLLLQLDSSYNVEGTLLFCKKKSEEEYGEGKIEQVWLGRDRPIKYAMLGDSVMVHINWYAGPKCKRVDVFKNKIWQKRLKSGGSETLLITADKEGNLSIEAKCITEMENENDIEPTYGEIKKKEVNVLGLINCWYSKDHYEWELIKEKQQLSQDKELNITNTCSKVVPHCIGDLKIKITKYKDDWKTIEKEISNEKVLKIGVDRIIQLSSLGKGKFEIEISCIKRVQKTLNGPFVEEEAKDTTKKCKIEVV